MTQYDEILPSPTAVVGRQDDIALLMKKIFKNPVCLFVLILLCFNVFVSSANADIMSDNLFNFKKAADLPGAEDISPISIIIAVINTLLGLLGLFFVILIMYAGFLFMTAQGDEKKVTKAKDIIRNAIIGVTIILLSYIVTRIVFNTILSVVKK
jgi:hypothetical protein